MTLTISLALLTGIIVFVLFRTGHLRFWPALAAALFGFALATTGIAPAINGGVNNVSGWLSGF
ncbi:hypothetical protein [Streptomyces minutiscleroticus]|uniref:Uncharacterized protein n=1 Tax=Streptomyces minutiscleroticus TaxID=68238 RepID=A0A918KCY3_9ACTN|nr:hypothetical protein [Streptomyces minutiscleroticus]GGX59105.1 hypothetical protein GCM10010358_11710 [Streptomyces minutiscleroticus]